MAFKVEQVKNNNSLPDKEIQELSDLFQSGQDNESHKNLVSRMDAVRDKLANWAQELVLQCQQVGNALVLQWQDMEASALLPDSANSLRSFRNKLVELLNEDRPDLEQLKAAVASGRTYYLELDASMEGRSDELKKFLRESPSGVELSEINSTILQELTDNGLVDRFIVTRKPS